MCVSLTQLLLWPPYFVCESVKIFETETKAQCLALVLFFILVFIFRPWVSTSRDHEAKALQSTGMSVWFKDTCNHFVWGLLLILPFLEGLADTNKSLFLYSVLEYVNTFMHSPHTYSQFKTVFRKISNISFTWKL